MNVQLIADTEYLSFFSEYLKKLEGITLDGGGEPEIIFDASFLDPIEKAERLSKLDTTAPILSNTLTMAATTAKAVTGANATVIGIPMLPHYFERQKNLELAFPVGSQEAVGEAEQFLSLFGKSTEVIQDAVGGVFPRTLAMIVNEAAFAVQESVAVPVDIDLAMKLGTNYPKGPLAWCDEIGAKAIVAILDALGKEYGYERYRAAALLRRYAEANKSFLAA